MAPSQRGNVAPRAARAQSVTKLAVVVASYAFHVLVEGARASPVAAWAAGGLGRGVTPMAEGEPGPGMRAEPFRKMLDMVMIFGLVLLGGVFAGLTLGLMGLDMVNLQVLMTSGSEEERRDASKVMRLLERGRHWVLVVLLLMNVIVNETLPVFLSEFGSGFTAVIVSTVLIVIFGEIVPQSICARYGLKIGAVCAPLVHVLMIIMAPVAWPTARFLDYCLGEEHGTTYRKAELKTFVSLHQQIGTEHLNDDEVTIIRAVLDLNDKCLRHVMTPIEDVYTMPSDYILDEEGVDKLVESGYSRVPVHETGKPDAIIGMLLVKRLIQYDPEDSWPVSRFQLTPLPEASPELNLLDAINYMQVGRSHMILVSHHPGEQTGALGVVTLEDIIEEMIGEEIVDETDVFVDVHNKIKVVRSQPRGTRQEQWQPLIRGIIERRRKHGGPTQTPLHMSFGTIASTKGRSRGRTKYGVVPATTLKDKVALKPLGPASRQYDSFGDAPANPASEAHQGASTSHTGTPEFAREYDPSQYDAFSVGSEGTSQQRRDSFRGHDSDHDYTARGPYIVEMGSGHNDSPRVITVADINDEVASDMHTLATAAAKIASERNES
ncbi:cell agglutination protein Mam3 [Malassezia sp. CBS 17886]|nr:cell agglutination protein Mam3 [Malassezia sp. CBS 17886]